MFLGIGITILTGYILVSSLVGTMVFIEIFFKEK